MRFNPLIQRLRHLGKQQDGSVAIIFAVTFAVLLFVGGVAVDYARGIQQQTDMQAAADTAVLAAVRAKTADDRLGHGQLEQIARDYFDKNFGDAIDIHSFDLIPDGDGYRVEVTGTLKTTITGVAGFNDMNINVSSTAETGPGRPLELALALDNTGSMSGSKLASLKDAANQLVDIMLDGAGNGNGNNDKTKIALVPFGVYVNVGLANRNAPWMEVADDTEDDEWNGCAGSRDYPLNIQDESFISDKVPGIMNVSCGDTITPLTSDAAELSAAIGGMNASGNTYIPGGLAWGWRVLSKAQPYVEGKPYNELKDEGGIKAVVLMTDGKNTRAPSYPAHTSTNTGLANSLTSELCTSVKDEDIYIYTIAFEVTDTSTKDMLKTCATKTNYYYDAGNANELSAAFKTIAGELKQLRLTH